MDPPLTCIVLVCLYDYFFPYDHSNKIPFFFINDDGNAVPWSIRKSACRFQMRMSSMADHINETNNACFVHKRLTRMLFAFDDVLDRPTCINIDRLFVQHYA